MARINYVIEINVNYFEIKLARPGPTRQGASWRLESFGRLRGRSLGGLMGAWEELGRQLWSDSSHGWSLLYQCQKKKITQYIVDNFGEGLQY